MSGWQGADGSLSADEGTMTCEQWYDQAYEDMGDISVYDIYEDSCLPVRCVHHLLLQQCPSTVQSNQSKRSIDLGYFRLQIS